MIVLPVMHCFRFFLGFSLPFHAQIRYNLCIRMMIGGFPHGAVNFPPLSEYRPVPHAPDRHPCQGNGRFRHERDRFRCRRAGFPHAAAYLRRREGRAGPGHDAVYPRFRNHGAPDGHHPEDGAGSRAHLFPAGDSRFQRRQAFPLHHFPDHSGSRRRSAHPDALLGFLS